MEDKKFIVEEIYAHENQKYARENLMNEDDYARILIEEIISELISDLK